MKKLCVLLFILAAFSGCGSEEVVQNPHFVMWPNPASHEAHVSGGGSNYSLKVFDSRGNKILDETGTGSFDYEIHITEKGTYYGILKMDGKEEKQTLLAQ